MKEANLKALLISSVSHSIEKPKQGYSIMAQTLTMVEVQSMLSRVTISILSKEVK